MTGRTIGHFEVLDKLGAGGMGVVWKARDTRLDRLVALKLLPADKVANQERKRRFMHEAKTASALNHPNIVTIHEISLEDGLDFIVMEYVRGKPLDQLIPRKGLSVAETLKYAIQIADALAKAHAAGIVHRDLKPSNIMVTDDGLVKVLDFGLAKLMEGVKTDESAATETLAEHPPLTEQGMIVGTAAYMSPEQAEGKPFDTRSDIFSFGSVLYEMVTGQRAFRGDTKVSTIAAILRDEIKPPGRLVESLPGEFERVVLRCLRKDPARRFQHMDDLKVALEELKAESESGALAGIPTVPRRRRGRLAFGAVAAAAAGLGLWYLAARNAGSDAALKFSPLTTYPGSETAPSFSPDGNQVAFSWDGDKQDNSDIYVNLIGAGTPLRLTTDPAPDHSPAWSPDGRSVAFLRGHGAGNLVMLVPAIGGPERTLGEVGEGEHPPALSWSPDGRWLASYERPSPPSPNGLVLLNVETGEKRKLTSPPATYTTGDSSPAFSPDGRTLVFSRGPLDTLNDLYLLELSNDYMPRGEPRRLTFHPGWVSAPAWTADGREIVYSTGSWENTRLWRVSLSGSRQPRELPFVGEGAEYPAISRQGNRLAFVRRLDDYNIWRVEVPGGATPQPGTALPPAGLIFSTRIEHTPALSPDGTKIAFSSNRSGTWEIWVCGRDGTNAVQLTAFNGQFTRYPRWSPDGKYLAFDSRPEGHADIFVMNSQGGKPRRVTSNPANDVSPAWSKDGQWIYFSSNRGGEVQVWKTRASGSLPEQPVQVTTKGGQSPVESPDGRFVYYGKNQELWRVPSEGGAETRILGGLHANNFAVIESGIYFLGYRPAEPLTWLQFYNFATGEVTQVVRIPREPHMGVSASADGRCFLYTQIDQVGSDLMLVENFR